MFVLRQIPRRLPLHRFFSQELSDFERQHDTPKCLKTETAILAQYGGRHTVTMLPGAGIGPELCLCVKRVFRKMGAPVDFETIDIDPEKSDNEEFERAMMSIKRNGVAIKGNLEIKSEDPLFQLRNVILRHELDLFAYILWCRSYNSVPSKFKDLDIVLIRQNTQGEYSMLEHSIGNNRVVESLKVVRRDCAERLARFAFDYATKNNRKKVTIIHKANIMKLADGLFLKVAREVAAQYPHILHNDMIIDNCCMQVVSNPQQFDVMLAPNLYGSILGNVLCGLSGGPGLMAGKNHGAHYSIFETGTRNSATAIAGKNVANPIAMLSTAANMLKHLGHDEFAVKLDNALVKTVEVDKVHTADVGGAATTNQVVDTLIGNLK